MKRFIIGALFGLLIAGNAAATNYYIRPLGGDLESGLDSLHAWATLTRAEGQNLAAGDTVFIYGGTYTSQRFKDTYPYISGTYAAPIVFRAMGDSVAVFISHGSTGDSLDCAFFQFDAGQTNIKIDGHSYAVPADSLYLKFIPLAAVTDPSGVIAWTNGGTNITVEGVGIEGLAWTARDYTTVATGMKFVRVDSLRVEHCSIQGCGTPTGIWSGGAAQAAGDAIYLESCKWAKINSNTLGYAANALVNVKQSSGYTVPIGIRITNNLIDNHWGGGVYLQNNARYSLVQGNIITYAGSSTTASKPSIILSGSRNVIRKNIIFSPSDGGIFFDASTLSSIDQRADSNLVYNNTIFKSGSYYSLFWQLGSDADCSIKANQIYNNVCYKSQGTIGGYSPEFYVDNYSAPCATNWLTSCYKFAFGDGPFGTAWNGNVFINNLFRRASEGSTDADIVVFKRPSTAGGTYEDYSLNDISLLDASEAAWGGNIGTNPLLTTETVDTTNSAGTWYRQKWDSPVQDAGVPVDDDIGALALTMAGVGWGWTNLTYIGGSIDIGAYEYPRPPAILIMQQATLEFPDTKVTAADTLTIWIKNVGAANADSAVILPVKAVNVGGAFDIVTPKISTTMYESDSISLSIEFAPHSGDSLFTGSILLYTGALDTLHVSGYAIEDVSSSTACSIDHGDIDFGDIDVGDIAKDTIVVWNSGTESQSVTIAITEGRYFTILSGGGAATLAANEKKTVIIKFAPLGARDFVDCFTTGLANCPGILLSGTGINRTHTKDDTTPIQEE